jgi:hypothetical protein
MKFPLVVLALAVPLIVSQAFAQSAQQKRMTVCNEEAGGMKGDERKLFMKGCLRKNPAKSAAQQMQQDKMKTCNGEAKGKTDAERRAFMS